MPKYSYRCKNCNSEFVYFHSMSDLREDCEACTNKMVLEKLPSRFVTANKEVEKQPGDIVKRSIEDIRTELEQEKEKLSNEFYNSDK
tara:strand:+ start:391 stop:651 length:261 start_codon:yes stop_codon:yes gene_type:complete